MFRTHLIVGADLTESSAAMLTLVSINYSHFTEVNFYRPVKPESRKLKGLQHAHTVNSLHSYRIKPTTLFLFNEVRNGNERNLPLHP
jgi:hypothetical protein